MSDGLLYCVVAGPMGILAEAYFKNDAVVNFKDVIQEITEKLPLVDGKKSSYTLSGFNFLCSVSKQMIFIVVYKEGFGLRIPSAFLDEITLIWFNTYGNNGISAPPNSMNNQFSRIMKQKMEFYSNPSVDKIKVINAQIEKVTEQLKDNLDKTIDRQQNISLLLEKTGMLQTDSFSFRSNARDMKRVFWWKNCKLWVILIIILIIIIGAIIVFVMCGWRLDKCLHTLQPVKPPTPTPTPPIPTPIPTPTREPGPQSILS